jgi:hypothetical protein
LEVRFLTPHALEYTSSQASRMVGTITVVPNDDCRQGW